MMSLTIRIILVSFLTMLSDWSSVGKKNAAIRSASRSYAEANYAASVQDHLKLVNEYELTTPNVNFNLALSYHYSDSLDLAQRTYQSLYSSPDKTIASFSFNQNGTILAGQKKYEEALDAFKWALIHMPENESARYNYELLSRWLQQNPEQKDQPKEQEEEQNEEEKNEEQQQQDQQQQNQEKKDGEGEEETQEDEASESQKKEDKSGEKTQEEKESEEASDIESDLSDREKRMEQLREKLKEMNISPEQASQILDAMNAAELRFIQQNKKKPTKRPSKNLPEW